MKRLALIAAMLVMRESPAVSADTLSWKADGAMPLYGTLETDNAKGFAVTLSVTPEVKAFDLILGSTESIHRVGFGFLNKNDGRRSATALRMKYSFIPSFSLGGGKSIFSESGAAFGFFDGGYFEQGGKEAKFKFRQLIYGYEQYVGLNWNVGKKHFFGIKGGGSWTGANLKDDYGSLSQWDNYGTVISGFGHLLPANGLRLRTEVNGWRTRYNPERYFFVEKWATEYEFRSELSVDVSRRLEAVPLLNYKKVDIERNRRADLSRVEYGGRVMMKDLIPAISTAYVKGVYAPWRHRKGSESLLAVGGQAGDWSAEVYQRFIRETYSTFVLDEHITGFQFAWKFGSLEELRGIDDYGYARKHKFQFYRDSGIEDVTGLSRVQQAERLGTLRKRNEWSGKNLIWKEAPDNGWGFRFQDETYAGRAGDCDEQSCLTGSMDSSNGYRNFSGAWWDFNGSYSGHAVEIVQDPDTGKWFWDEYGQIYKIKNVGWNSTRDEVMREALKQNHRFSALPVNPNSDAIYYTLIDCSEPNTYNMGQFTWYGKMPDVQERPNVEYGYELFTQKGFLFGRQR